MFLIFECLNSGVKILRAQLFFSGCAEYPGDPSSPTRDGAWAPSLSHWTTTEVPHMFRFLLWGFQVLAFCLA